MLRRGKFLGACLLSATLLAGVSGAVLADELDAKSSFADEIRATAAEAEDERVRVVVSLTTPAGAQARGSDAEDIDAIRAAVRAQVDAVLDEIGLSAAAAASEEIGLVRAEAHEIFTFNATLSQVERLAADERVDNIHPDFELEPMLSQSLPLIQMPQAYSNFNATGSGRAIATFDTGVATGHQWFDNRLAANGEACFSGSGDTNRTFCPNGQLVQVGPGAGINCTGFAGCDHGTHVAGITAGRNNVGSTPPHGVSRDGRYITYQVFSKPATGGGITASFGDITAALSNLYARRNQFGVPVDAVNMSLGTGHNISGDCDSSLPGVKNVIDDLRAVGIATVIAAGNSQHRDGMGMPACISTAVSVASSDTSDVISWFSNVSALTTMIAPGSSIVAPILNNQFGSKSGTSMAAPHVAGIFGAIRSACPNIRRNSVGINTIVNALISTGRSISDTRSGGQHTKRRPNVARALAALNCDNGGRRGKVVFDFDGDGRSDVLFRRNDGPVHLWTMNGTNIASSAHIANISTAWDISVNGDFDGDGRSDILWRHPGNGTVHLWRMNGANVIGSHHVASTGTSWDIIAFGDFNGNGSDDILWRHTSGALHMWLMNGPNVVGSHSLGTISTAWSIPAVGDFNGNGRRDILWRHTSGNVHLWLMNGANVVGSHPVGSTSTAWEIDSTGDFNGNGRSDILWRHPSAGNVHLWLMNGATVTGSHPVATVSTAWQIATLGDFNGDGRSGILWHHTSGALHMWHMNGQNVVGGGSLPTIGTAWDIINRGQQGAVGSDEVAASSGSGVDPTMSTPGATAAAGMEPASTSAD